MKYEITKEQILAMARCSLSPDCVENMLRTLYPSAFEEEWKEILSSDLYIRGNSLMHDGYYIFNINPTPIGGIDTREYKIKLGAIYWRRK
jgi:hypothetical protein